MTNENWLEIIKKKKQTCIWSDEIPPFELIEEVLNDLHQYCPSKQNLRRYTITVLKNYENEERKLDIYKNTDRESISYHRKYNGQVLAPYLIGFSSRYKIYNYQSNDERTKKDNIDRLERDSHLDIGIASCFLAYSAVSKGLDIGFCGCISGNISKYFGNKQPNLLLGIGYRSNEKKFICPIRNISINESALINEPKPFKDEYIFYR